MVSPVWSLTPVLHLTEAAAVWTYVSADVKKQFSQKSVIISSIWNALKVISGRLVGWFNVQHVRCMCALPQAKCIKTGPGSHSCQCLAGWREDGDECQPINNCDGPDNGGCHYNATCIYVGPGQVTSLRWGLGWRLGLWADVWHYVSHDALAAASRKSRALMVWDRHMNPVVNLRHWYNWSCDRWCRSVWKKCIFLSSYSAACETDRAIAHVKPATKEMGWTVKLSISV